MIKLHITLVAFTVGYFAFFVFISVFAYLLITQGDLHKEQLNNLYLLTPLTIWLVGIIGSVILALTIKCASCKKLALFTTSTKHKRINKGAFWFLDGLPARIKCEHCGAPYENNT